MVKEQQGKWVVPNPQIPRSFGLMNIIFGVSLALARAGLRVLVSLHTDVHEADARTVKQVEADAKAERDEKIADLKKQEAAAKTEEEKEELTDERGLDREKSQRQRGAVRRSLKHERHVRQAHRRLLCRRGFRRGHPQRAHDRLRGRAPRPDGMGAPAWRSGSLSSRSCAGSR